MHVELRHVFRFEAAHRLPRVSEGHPCARLHGHSYAVTIRLAGECDPHTGWLIDFGDVAAIVHPVVAELDHRLLNDIAGLENPTSEHLARWLWQRIEPALAGLAAIEVAETADTSCVYRGET
jgi:6-pyruvoyltetrahydropterin/6-carboxytetrahydropterin synthase